MSRAVGLALLLLVSVIKCLDQAAGKYVVLGGEAEETVVDSQLGKVHSRTSESGGKEVNFVFQVSRPDISTGPVAAFLLKVEAVHDFSNRSLSVIARTQDDMKKWEMPMETNVTVTMERVINLFNCLRDKNTTHVVISVSSLEPIQYQISLVSIPEFVVQVDQEVEVKGVGFLSPGLRYVDLNDVPKDALLRFEAHSPQIFSCARISLTPFFEKITTFPESSLEKGLFEAHQTMLGLAAFSLQRGHFGKGVLVKLVRVSDSSGVCDSNDLSKNPMSSSMKDFTFSLSDKPYGDTDFQMGIAAGCGALLCIVILSVTCFCVISQDPLISRRDKMQARDSCPCHGHLVPCSSRRSELKSENMDENNGLFKEENYLQVHNKTDLSWNNQQVSSLARPDSGIDSPTVNKEVSAFSAEIQKRANDGAVVEAAWSRQSERLPAISKGTSGVKFSVSELVIEETSSLELGESSSGCCSLSVDESHSVSSRHSSNHDPGGPHRDREIEPLYQAACQCNNGSGHEERLLKIMFKRSDLYVWLVLIMGVFYSLPAFQLVLGDQLHMKGAGNLDLCYYNFLCAVPALGLSDFNHTFSNLWYVVLGVLFILLTLHQSRNHNAKGDKKKRLKHSCYRKFRLELNESSTANNTSTDMDALGVSESTVQILPNQVSPSKEESDEVVGLPRHYGLFYAMGSALVFQGLLSTCYHLCPTKANFQFDATFMYVVATLCFMKIYQFRHSQHASAAYKVSWSLTRSAINVFGILGISGVRWSCSDSHSADYGDAVPNVDCVLDPHTGLLLHSLSASHVHSLPDQTSSCAGRKNHLLGLQFFEKFHQNQESRFQSEDVKEAIGTNSVLERTQLGFPRVWSHAYP